MGYHPEGKECDLGYSPFAPARTMENSSIDPVKRIEKAVITCPPTNDEAWRQYHRAKSSAEEHRKELIGER